MIYNLLLSLQFLHSCQLIHRDIKPSNILLQPDCTIRLCDFGFCRGEIDPKVKEPRPLSPVCYSRFYRPPEIILLTKKYSTRADIWSTGCLISDILKYLKFSQEHENESEDSTAIKQYLKTRALFAGKSCYPISPAVDEDKSPCSKISKDDQMLKIL